MLTYMNTHHSFTKILKNSYKHKLTYIHMFTQHSVAWVCSENHLHTGRCLFSFMYMPTNYTCALTYKKYIYCYLQIYSHLIMLLSAVNHEYLYTYIHTQTHSVPHTNKYDHTFTYLHPQVRTCLYFFFFHSFFEARKATLFGKQLMDKMAG